VLPRPELHDKWIKHCQNAIRDPAGGSRRTNFPHNNTASGALWLMYNLSTDRPTAGSADTAYCRIAALLWEAITGKRAKLHRACKTLLHAYAHLWPPTAN
jgi:hypothetical protein